MFPHQIPVIKEVLTSWIQITQKEPSLLGDLHNYSISDFWPVITFHISIIYFKNMALLIDGNISKKKFVLGSQLTPIGLQLQFHQLQLQSHQLQLQFLLLSAVEAKKRRTAGHQTKEAVPESTKSVFVTFLREAGITLRQDGTPNEIGKTLAV